MRVKRKVVYICSPYSGDVDKNIKNAYAYCRNVIKNGCIPIAPHLFFPQFLNDDNPEERELALSMNKELILRCDEVWVFGDTVSKGMAEEIEFARAWEKIIHHIVYIAEDKNET